MDDLSQYLGLYLQTAKEYIQALNKSLLVLEKNPADVSSIEEIFRSAHSLKSQSAAMGFISTGYLCHTIEDIFYEIKNNKSKLDADLASLLFVSFDALKNSIDNIEKTSKEINLQVQIDKLKQHTGVTTEGVGKSARTVKEIPPVAPQDVKRPTEIKTIPVKVEQLDEMLDLLEELLVYRFELKKLSQDLDNKDLESYYQSTQKILDSLQFEVMQARTVPLSLIFEHYPRTVRDVAVQEKKEVEVQITGGDLSLDRKIVEKLDEPLIHLLRNAVSHGIEKKGIIKIMAKREPDYIVIEISDNGRGIEWEKIAQKANVKTTDPKKLEELLFSGISTSASISQVSGRGVGLLTVKKMISDFGGSISVSKNVPTGTIFSLKLPLSLSIMKSLLVLVGEHKYAIPALSVSRSLLLKPEEIKKTAQQEAIVFDGTDVPLVRLSERFGLPLKKDGKDKPNDDTIVVVVNLQKDKVGLVVNNVLETVDLIVRPLPETLQKAYFAGTTLLTNGEIALMINSYGLI